MTWPLDEPEISVNVQATALRVQLAANQLSALLHGGARGSPGERDWSATASDVGGAQSLDGSVGPSTADVVPAARTRTAGSAPSVEPPPAPGYQRARLNAV